MTDSSDVCGGGSMLDDCDASGPGLEHSFLDDSVIGIPGYQTLIFEDSNTRPRRDSSFGIEPGGTTGQSSALEPRPR